MHPTSRHDGKITRRSARFQPSTSQLIVLNGPRQPFTPPRSELESRHTRKAQLFLSSEVGPSGDVASTSCELVCKGKDTAAAPLKVKEETPIETMKCSGDDEGLLGLSPSLYVSPPESAASDKMHATCSKLETEGHVEGIASSTPEAQHEGVEMNPTKSSHAIPETEEDAAEAMHDATEAEHDGPCDAMKAGSLQGSEEPAQVPQPGCFHVCCQPVPLATP